MSSLKIALISYIILIRNAHKNSLNIKNKNSHELIISSDIVEKPYQIKTYLIRPMKRSETI